MHIHDHTTADSCSSCPMTECREKVAQSSADGLAGWPFALCSIGVFLLPLILSVICATAAGDSETARFIYGTAGLVLGMVTGVSGYKIFKHVSSKKETDS